MAVVIPIVSEFDGKGINKAVAEFQNLEGAGAKSAFALKKAMLPAAAAAGALAAGLGMATKAAAEDQAAQKALEVQLVNSTGATQDQIKEVEKAISVMSKQGAVADDVLRPAFAALVRGTKDINEAQKQMALVLDISRATSIDAEIVERPGVSITGVNDAGQLDSGDDDQGAAADPHPVTEAGADDPTGAAPPRARDAQARTMLSNPHTQSQLDSAPHTQPSLLDSTEAEGMDAATPSDSLASLTHVSDAVQHKGGGGDEVWRSSEDVDMETPPGGNWKEK